MTTENTDQVLDTTPDVTSDPEIEKAQAGGWKPLEEWEGNPEDWIDAKTFNKNGEYIEHIKSLSADYKKAQKRINKLEKEFSTLADHHSKVAQLEREKAIKELKAAKKEALSNLDADKVMEIDDKIEELRESSLQEPKAAEVREDIDYQVEVWKKANTWYNDDKVLKAAANGLIQELLQEDPSRAEDPADVLEEVTKTLKLEFPNKFGSARTRSTSATIEPDNNGKTKATSYSRRLTEEQRGFANKFIKMGAVSSLEDYAKQLYDIGELK